MTWLTPFSNTHMVHKYFSFDLGLILTFPVFLVFTFVLDLCSPWVLCFLFYFVTFAPCVFPLWLPVLVLFPAPVIVGTSSPCVSPVSNYPCTPCVYKSLSFPLSVHRLSWPSYGVTHSPPLVSSLCFLCFFQFSLFLGPFLDFHCFFVLWIFLNLALIKGHFLL